MGTLLPQDILALAAGAVIVGAALVLVPLFGVVTGRLKYSSESNKFVRGKDGQQFSAGPVFSTILLGALLVVAPITGYYLSFDNLELAGRNDDLAARLARAEADLSGKVDPPRIYTFSGRVVVSFPDGVEITPGMDDMTRVRVQQNHPGIRLTEDGKFTLRLPENRDGQLPTVAIIYPTSGTGFGRGTKTFTPGELVEEPAGSGELLIAGSALRENVIEIELEPKPVPVATGGPAREATR